MKKKDLRWLFLFPVYLLLGTIRHEGFHALAAVAEGAKIHQFVFWPSLGPGGEFYFGYVSWQGTASWITTAAPYAGDLLTFLAGFLLLASIRIQHRGLWINILILTMLSPLLNSAYNYGGGLRKMNDVGFLLHTLNPLAVHLYFAPTMTLYAFGIWYFVKKRGAPG